MSGTVIRVIEDTHYTFNNLASGGQQSILVAQHVDVSQFRNCPAMDVPIPPARRHVA